MPLSQFHPIVARWFASTLGEPTAAQCKGWPAIRAGRHTLIAAPTGSGKTLAAFLSALDDLFREGLDARLPDEVRVVYVSPLKALSTDIHKNLAEPRRGIHRLAAESGLTPPKITAAVRTGDTTSAERAAMLREPPHILVTTPESLYLLLTAERSREMLRTTRLVIVDEIHAVIGTRRGAHLALTLERLQQVAAAPLLRLGLSATQKPIEEVARYLTGTNAAPIEAACSIVDEGHCREMDLGIEVPGSPLEAVMANEVWEEYYDRLAALIESHRTTLVFVNTRRMAERVARHLSDRLGDDAVTAHHGSLSREKRHDAETRLKDGGLKALVATASLELGIDIGHVDLVCQIGSPHRIATLLQRVGRSGHTVAGLPKGRIFPASRDDLVEAAALLRAVRLGELDRIVIHEQPLDVLAQQIVAEVACGEYAEDDLYAVIRRAWPYRDLSRADFNAVVQMVSAGIASRRAGTGGSRRGALVHRDEVNARLRGRRGARMLALTCGGAIPELADYRVVLDPDDTFIGTLNEDFAIESTAGDVFQLGNASWRVLQIGAGVVRVADARGTPPNLPFWIGEAPGRSDELSQAVSRLRAALEGELPAGTAVEWLMRECLLDASTAEQVASYLGESFRMLGALPTHDTLIVERFFDDSGGMQLVLHSPFGSRVNRAWGLALRKRFCRQFNFELQAAATEDGLLLSLGPQHSFPLTDVFRYLHPATARDVLVQAFLDAPVFQTRWRWNATISLAVPRSRGGRKVPPQLQRTLADDLLAAVFPDAAACLENIPGDRQVPDHPLVNQTVRDCLEEAMDFEQLASILTRIHAGAIRLVARDTPEPSPLAHEILNARPYAFLDDAPLEERRTQAVHSRRATQPASGDDLCALDVSAITRVREEARPDPRDADELHDALLTGGLLREGDVPAEARDWFAELARCGRAACVAFGAAADAGGAAWIATERSNEIRAVHPQVALQPHVQPPASRAGHRWSREAALVELVRGRLTIEGPTTMPALAGTLGVGIPDIEQSLLALEGEGVVLRGSFTPGLRELEWCDRRLLARIHRHTIDRLRAEIVPASPAEFMRFLFVWQHVEPSSRLTGIDGLRAVLALLDGTEAPARAWERSVLPARVEDFNAPLLDMLCLTGEVGWARLSAGPAQVVGATPIALFLREHADDWQALRGSENDHEDSARSAGASAPASAGSRVLEVLRERGASFAHELTRACSLDDAALRGALAELAAAGLVSSDAFAGVRQLVEGDTGSGSRARRADRAGRWWAVTREGNQTSRERAVEQLARALLRRYGIVCRRLLAREANAAPWRELTRVYRRLEARGEIRGGRFVSGLSGEQFALPEAVERLREIRRSEQNPHVIVISAADPLNLTGIITSGERVRTVAGNRVAYRDGVPAAAMEGDYIRPLADVTPEAAEEIACALAGRRVPVVSGYVGALRN